MSPKEIAAYLERALANVQAAPAPAKRGRKPAALAPAPAPAAAPAPDVSARQREAARKAWETRRRLNPEKFPMPGTPKAPADPAWASLRQAIAIGDRKAARGLVDTLIDHAATVRIVEAAPAPAPAPAKRALRDVTPQTSVILREQIEALKRENERLAKRGRKPAAAPAPAAPAKPAKRTRR